MFMTSSASAQVVLREDRGAVSLLTLNRPAKLNALSNDLIAALMAALDSIELDRSVRAVVLTGAGRAFSAGRTSPDSGRTFRPARPRRSRTSCVPARP
jgi:enoyl-CoA hydratase/carnithine racemase